MGRTGRTVVVVAAVAVCAAAVAALRLAQWSHTPRPVPAGVVVVPRGADAREVARILADAGVFPCPTAALWSLRLWGEPGGLKAGVYRYDRPVSPRAVLADLAAGRVELVSVTLPEGWTGREMAVRLDALGVTDGRALTALVYDPASPGRWGLPGPTLEGFLYPDTYRFARGLGPERVVDELVRRFRAVVEPLEPEALRAGLDLLSWVTLASVVEKETGRAEERPVVAAVFLNRLARGMRLESDPTVIYGLDRFDGNLRRADLRRDTPYNTYTRRGLPPGPIANPGRASLKAVVRPADVDYLYFVSRGDGTHVFSATYAEHRRAVARYQLGRGR